MMPEAWFWCDIVDTEDRVEPDWSKVPEDRRALIRQRWEANTTPAPKRWKLWGPQIHMYLKMPGIASVVVVGESP